MNRVVCLGLLFICSSAIAVTRYVDINSPTPTPPYTSWATAAANIQDAVDAAVEGDTIWVADGHYLLTDEITVSKALTIQSVNGPEVTIVNAQQYGRVFNLSAFWIRLSGFTITYGYASGDGGGIYCSFSPAIITNCVVSENNATGNGGGVFSGTAIDCIISDNSANDGGGIHSGSATSCIISNNSASSDGGGAYSSMLKKCKIIGNTAYDSGGGLRSGSAENCLIINNQTTQYIGGILNGLGKHGGGGSYSATVRNCTICDNTSASWGGGVNRGTVYNSIIYYNNGYSTSDNAYGSTDFGSCGTGLDSGNGNITATPVFVDRANDDYRLASGSPCIDSGVGVYVSSSTDLDGGPRIINSIVDMGAYEYITVPVIALSTSSLTLSVNAGSSPESLNFEIQNIGVSSLNYTITDNVTWHSVSPSNGSSTGEADSIAVNFNTATLAAGIYYGEITIAATGADNTPQTISVTLTVVPPSIALNKASMTLSSAQGVSPSSQSFTVRNSGNSGPMGYTITDNATWLSVSPPTGSSTGEVDTITVNFNTTALSAGSYTGLISIASSSANNTPQSISVTLIVVSPSIALNRSSITLSSAQGVSPSAQSFTVRNSGNSGPMGYTITDNATWLSVSPPTGSSTGEVDTITVEFDTATLSAGSYTGLISVVSVNADNTPKTIPVYLTVVPSVIQLSHSELVTSVVQGSSPTDLSFTVVNSGNSAPMPYSITDNLSWLSVSPTSGSSAGETDTITVEFNTAALAAGSYAGLITVASPQAVNSPQTIDVDLQVYAPVIYVAKTGDDSNSGWSWDAAKATIQAGVDELDVAGGTVLVSNGTYAATSPISVNKNIWLESVTGPEVTVVDGGWYDRCFSLGNYSCTISGFKIVNGYAVGSGGGIYCSGSSPIVTNCIVSGNSATSSGGGMYRGAAYNCAFNNNSAPSGGGTHTVMTYNSVINNNTASSGGGVYGSTASGCLIFGNSSVSGGGVYNGTANNCTICDNTSSSDGGGMHGGTANNSVVYYNTGNGSYSNMTSGITAYGSCSPSLVPGILGNIVNEPLFVDRLNGNYRLLAESPCVDAGLNAYAFTSTDLDGYARILNGRVDMGAYEYQPGTADDDDGDGLTNAQELQRGTNPYDPDSDGDGFDDGFEVSNGMNALVADTWIVPYVTNNADEFGLDFSGGYIDVAVGQMLLSTTNGEARLSIQLEQSDDLVIWTNAGSAVEWVMPVDTNTQFFRVRSEP